MGFGSLMNQSIESSPFDKAVIRITGPSHGATVTVTGGGALV